MARILIGNIKGPQGEQGPQGIQGPIGPEGPQGPLPPLINNGLTTEAGIAALDAVQANPDVADTLGYKLAKLYSDIDVLNTNFLVLSTTMVVMTKLFQQLAGYIWVQISPSQMDM